MTESIFEELDKLLNECLDLRKRCEELSKDPVVRENLGKAFKAQVEDGGDEGIIRVPKRFIGTIATIEIV